MSAVAAVTPECPAGPAQDRWHQPPWKETVKGKVRAGGVGESERGSGGEEEREGKDAVVATTYRNTCTHLIEGDTDVNTSSACAHTTRVSSADNRNNKHKHVVRPYKCMSQCRSDGTSGCSSGPHKPHCWSHDCQVTT